MPRQRSAFTLIAALLAGLVTRNPARAYEEQMSVDLALGYAGVANSEALASQQLALDAGVTFGIADWLLVRSALGYGALFDGQHDLAHAARLRLEGAYLLDLLQWVPFFGLGGGLWATRDAAGPAIRPTGHLVFGLDYLATRSWTVGCDVRIGMVWVHTEAKSFTEGQLRISRMFDLFR